MQESRISITFCQIVGACLRTDSWIGQSGRPGLAQVRMSFPKNILIYSAATITVRQFTVFIFFGSAYDYTVPAKGKELVKTDIQIEVPEGCYGRVAPRSGLAVKNFIDVGAGVIDEDYRGNVGVVLFNHSDNAFEIKKGDRIAQLICERITYPEVVEVDTLTDTVRGAGGFGSTGTN